MAGARQSPWTGTFLGAIFYPCLCGETGPIGYDQNFLKPSLNKFSPPISKSEWFLFNRFSWFKGNTVMLRDHLQRFWHATNDVEMAAPALPPGVGRRFYLEKGTPQLYFGLFQKVKKILYKKEGGKNISMKIKKVIEREPP